MREDAQKIRGRGLDESPCHEATDWLALQEFLEAGLGIAVVGGVDEPCDIEPCAGGEVWVLGVEVDLGQLAAEDGLALRVILGLEEF